MNMGKKLMKLTLNCTYVITSGIIITITLTILSGFILLMVQADSPTDKLAKFVLVLTFFSMIPAFWLKVLRDAKVELTDRYVSRPSLFLENKRIFWKEVQSVKIIRRGVYIYGGKNKIMITPHAYHTPKNVIAFIQKHTWSKM